MPQDILSVMLSSEVFFNEASLDRGQTLYIVEAV